MNKIQSFPTNVFMNQYGKVIDTALTDGCVEITRHNRPQVYVLSPEYMAILNRRICMLERALHEFENSNIYSLSGAVKMEVGSHLIQIEHNDKDDEISIRVSKKE